MARIKKMCIRDSRQLWQARPAVAGRAHARDCWQVRRRGPVCPRLHASQGLSLIHILNIDPQPFRSLEDALNVFMEAYRHGGSEEYRDANLDAVRAAYSSSSVETLSLGGNDAGVVEQVRALMASMGKTPSELDQAGRMEVCLLYTSVLAVGRRLLPFIEFFFAKQQMLVELNPLVQTGASLLSKA